MEIGPKQLADRKPLSLRRVQRLFLTNSAPWWGTVCWSLDVVHCVMHLKLRLLQQSVFGWEWCWDTLSGVLYYSPYRRVIIWICHYVARQFTLLLRTWLELCWCERNGIGLFLLLLQITTLDVFVSPELYKYMIQSCGHSSSRIDAAKLLHPFHPKNDSCMLLVKNVMHMARHMSRDSCKIH